MTKRDPLSANEKEHIESLLSKKLQSYKPSGTLRRKILKSLRGEKKPLNIFEFLFQSQLQLTVSVLLLATAAGTTGYFAYHSTYSNQDIPIVIPIPKPTEPSVEQQEPTIEKPVKPPTQIEEPSKEPETESPAITGEDPMEPTTNFPAKDSKDVNTLQQNTELDSKSEIIQIATTDIAITKLSVSVFPPEETGFVTVYVKNSGDVNITFVDIQANFNGEIQTFTLTDIRVGKTDSHVFSHIFNETGEYTLTVILDPYKKLSELNKSNNRIEQVITVE